MKRPDFLIVGSGKAGTTYVDSYLRTHSEVGLPKGIKETHFFYQNQIRNEAYNARGVYNTISPEDYSELFAEHKEKTICGETCPSYLFFNEETIKSLKEYYLDFRKIKILIILREPVSKILSHYHFIINNLQYPYQSLEELIRKEKNGDFNRSLDLPDLFLLSGTEYSHLIAPYLQSFDHVKIMFYEDLKNNGDIFLKEVCEFLNISFQPIKTERLIKNESNKRIPKNKLVQFLLSIGRKLPKGLIRILPLKKINKYYTRPSQISDATLKELEEFSSKEKLRLEALLNFKITQW